MSSENETRIMKSAMMFCGAYSAFYANKDSFCDLRENKGLDLASSRLATVHSALIQKDQGMPRRQDTCRASRNHYDLKLLVIISMLSMFMTYPTTGRVKRVPPMLKKMISKSSATCFIIYRAISSRSGQSAVIL